MKFTVYWILSKCREKFCDICFICIESTAIIAQSIRMYWKTFAIHQKSAKTAKLFSCVAFVVYSIFRVSKSHDFCIIKCTHAEIFILVQLCCYTKNSKGWLNFQDFTTVFAKVYKICKHRGFSQSQSHFVIIILPKFH